MIMEIRRAVRWRFIGILLDKSRVELPGLPFISADEDEIRAESVRRARAYDKAFPGKWVMNTEMIPYNVPYNVSPYSTSTVPYSTKEAM